MVEAAHEDVTFEVDCPHCHRRFRAELLSPDSPRQTGFKCPHCRLFVSYDRTANTTSE